MRGPLRAVIVEDSDAAYVALAEQLRANPRIAPVGRATSEHGALELIAAEQPDLVLLDLGLAPGSGAAVLRSLRRARSTACVLVVSNQDSEVLRLHCLEAGADGVYDKCRELHRLREHLAALPVVEPCVTARVAKLPQRRRSAVAALPTLDRITALAADVAGCPMAAVSLFDEARQWLVARIGLDMPTTSLNLAFCIHAAPGVGVLAIPDARLDARFRFNPLLDAPVGLRFYAGVPLQAADGGVFGALCVLDRVPKTLSPAQRALLEGLGREAKQEIERSLRAVAAEPVPAAGTGRRPPLAHQGVNADVA